MKTKKTWQVWVLLFNERGGSSWQAVSRRYATKTAAARFADALWLETRIEQQDADES